MTASLPPADHQAFGHCDCPHAGPAASPHHADHGLRTAPVSKESQRSENRPGEELSSSFLAGILEADDCRELPTEFTGGWLSGDGLRGDQTALVYLSPLME